MLTSSSPSQKKPKNAILAKAQIRVLLGLLDWVRTEWILVSNTPVMGNLVFCWPPACKCRRDMPAKIRLSVGSKDWSRGSGKPREIWRLHTAERYVLIVLGDSPSSAK